MNKLFSQKYLSKRYPGLVRKLNICQLKILYNLLIYILPVKKWFYNVQYFRTMSNIFVQCPIFSYNFWFHFLHNKSFYFTNLLINTLYCMYTSYQITQPKSSRIRENTTHLYFPSNVWYSSGPSTLMSTLTVSCVYHFTAHYKQLVIHI